ncbi:hypothetical protein CL615_01315 [archaeon]|nr:hypothetical protein [archaeon]|tara:strand:- start:5835 stop:6854 length:1020 start_codon:yes stop_codon:yes gene_type:complete
MNIMDLNNKKYSNLIATLFFGIPLSIVMSTHYYSHPGKLERHLELWKAAYSDIKATATAKFFDDSKGHILNSDIIVNSSELHPVNKKDIKLNLEQKLSLEQEVDNNINKLITNQVEKRGLEKAFSRISQYDDYITNAASKNNLDDNLITALIARESKGLLRNPSHKGANGLMHLMPKTAKHELGLTIDKYIDERLSPDSVFPGVKYLNKFIKEHGNVFAGLASYNGGPTRIRRIVRENGKGWEDIKNKLPHETKQYVVEVLSRYKILKDPKKYNINIDQKPLYSEKINNSGVHIVKSGETFNLIAKKHDVKPSSMKEINPTIIDYSKIYVDQKIRVPRT